MAIMLTLIIAQCLIMATEGILYSQSSDLLETYACLEETSVVYITYNMFFTKIFLPTLEDLCTKISFFDHYSRKIVQWRGNIASNLDESNLEQGWYSTLGKVVFEDLIESFIDQNFENGSITTNTSTKQILFIDLIDDLDLTERMKKAIVLIEKNTKWNVILICYLSSCPKTTNLPIHRIVATFKIDDFVKRKVKDLIRNPNFNRFEFLKHVEIKSENLTCLAKKTVHILIGNLNTLELFEIIAFMKSNIEENNNKTKFIIYISWLFPDEFLEYYLEENRLDYITMVYGIPKILPTQTGNGVLFIYVRYLPYITIGNYSVNSRNSVVFFDVRGFNRDSRELVEAWYNQQAVFKKTVQKLSTKIYKDLKEFSKNFMENLLDASCF